MKFKALTNKVTSKVGRQVLTAQKHSPALLFGAGVVGVVSTVVLASCATLKMEGILKEAEADKQKIEKAKDIAAKAGKEYTEEDVNKDRLLVRTKLALKVLKLYAPAITVGVVSIGCLTGSHLVLNKRNAGLTAAYAALDKGFKEYRGRVINEMGAEKDAEFRYGLIEKEIVEETEEGPVTKTVKATDPNKPGSIYARVFGSHTSKSWQETPAYNQMFIQCQQNYANDKLRANGHVFLNEVYDMLGLDRTKEGAVVGWVRGHGDDFIDFGVYSNMRGGQDFVNGDRHTVWLDFNVDGVIYDLI